MQQVTYCDQDDEKAEKVKELTGGYNDFPPNWRELTEEEFAKSEFFNQDPSYIEHRQMIGERGKGMTSAILYHSFRAGEGFGLVQKFWEGKIRYFAFGCDHKWKVISPTAAAELGMVHFGMCDTAYQCETCGTAMMIDSSG